MHNRISVYLKFESIWISLFLSGCALNVHAETIYQWTDPWGQIQYSKTPVPGSMVSDLTELPEITETTEQQKKDAMVRKLREMRQNNRNKKLRAAAHQQSNAQALRKRNHCKQLRILKSDIYTHQLWQYQLFGFPIFPNNQSHLYHNLSREIYNTCR